MLLAELPRLFNAIDLLGLDNGGNAMPKAVIPETWIDRALQAEDELLHLTKDEVETLVMGEHTDQQIIARRAPAADDLLAEAFDGELSESFMEPWTSIFDARKAEERHAKKKQPLSLVGSPKP
jgi:hypothetical protein